MRESEPRRLQRGPAPGRQVAVEGSNGPADRGDQAVTFLSQRRRTWAHGEAICPAPERAGSDLCGALVRAVLVFAEDLLELARRFRLQRGIEARELCALPAHDRRDAGAHDGDAVLLAQTGPVGLGAWVAIGRRLRDERVTEAAAAAVSGDGGVVAPSLAVVGVE